MSMRVVVVVVALACSGLLVPAGAAELATIWYARVEDPGHTDGSVWKVNGDGTGDQMVTTGGRPRLSQSGNYLLFDKGNIDPSHGSLYVRNMATTVETLVFGNNGDFVVHYDFNLDESKVIFDYSCDIEIANRDSTNRQTLIPSSGCYDDAPIVNPVDGRIAFHNIHNSLWVADADGKNRTAVPGTQAVDTWPAWSADGQWLSFGRYPDLNSGSLIVDYYKVHPDGTGLTLLTPFHAGAAEGFQPRGIWTADGTSLVAAGTLFGVTGLYAIPTDGSGTIERLSISEGNAPYFVGSVTGSALTGTVVLPATSTTTSSTTTTSTTTTSSTSTSSTSSSTSSTSTTSSSTTTTLAPVEICGNCLDDNHNDLIDFEDPACCGGAALDFSVSKARIKPAGTASKLQLKGGLTTAVGVDPTKSDVAVQLRSTTGELLCARLPATSFTKKKTTYTFRDRDHQLASAAGIDLFAIRIQKSGKATVKLRGSQARFATPAAGTLRITLGLAADAGRCGGLTKSFTANKKGALRFP